MFNSFTFKLNQRLNTEIKKLTEKLSPITCSADIPVLAASRVNFMSIYLNTGYYYSAPALTFGTQRQSVYTCGWRVHT